MYKLKPTRTSGEFTSLQQVNPDFRFTDLTTTKKSDTMHLPIGYVRYQYCGGTFDFLENESLQAYQARMNTLYLENNINRCMSQRNKVLF